MVRVVSLIFNKLGQKIQKFLLVLFALVAYSTGGVVFGRREGAL